MDKLRAMHIFCRTVETGSFAGAARSLDVVPSAVSKVIAALEQELGFPLLNRSTRGFSLTEEGAAYCGQCRQILQDIELAEGAGREQGLPVRGTLRIGMHPGLRFAVLTQLGPFLDRHPGLVVETVITNSPAAVVSDGLDLVLHIGRLPDSSLVARQLGWARPLVCASPAYLSLAGEPRHPADIERHHAVSYARRDEEPNTRWVFTRHQERCEVEVRARSVSRDGVGVIDAVLGGCGLGRPFDVSVRHWLRNGQLREVISDWKGEPQAIAAVLPPYRRSASAKVRAYLEHFASTGAGEPPD
jgi:DNA-binding transcriptional LysR family regulator